MVSLKKTPKKLIAVLLSLLMLMTAIPVGLFTTVFAATNDCLAIEVDSIKVYFYGVDTLDVKDNKVTYTGGDETVSTICVDGSDEVDTADVITNGRSVEFTNDWLSNQSGWIAIICDRSIDLPTSEPNIDVDKSAPVITEDDITGIPTEWTKDNVTITVNASDDGTGVVAYSLDKNNWQTENTFDISENGTYTFYAKDAVGNISVGTAIIVDKIDKISPTFTVAADPNTWTSQSVTIKVTASDPLGELDKKAYKFDDDEWTNEKQFVVNDNSTHKISVRDKAGNVTEDEFAADKYDNEEPTITNVQLQASVAGLIWTDIDYSKDHTSKLAKYRVAVTADDNEKSGVKGYYISNEKINDFKGIEFNSKSIIPVEAGSKFYVYAIDNVGNISDGYYVSLLEDSDAPVVNHTQSPAAETPTNGSVVFTITADDLSGIKEYGVSDKKMTGVEALESDDIEWQTDNTFEFKDCKKHYIYVKDNTNANINDGYEIQALNYNDKAPAKPVVSRDNKEWTNETVNVTLSAEPSVNTAGTSFEIVEYAKDGEWQSNNVFEINDAKTHKYQVKDSAGIISEAKEFAVNNYDAEAPKLDYVEFSQKNSGKLAELLNKLSFGRFFNKALQIDVKTSDSVEENNNNNDSEDEKYNNVSGVKKIELQFFDSKDVLVKTYSSYEFDVKKIGNKEKSQESFTFEDSKDKLPENFKGYVKVLVTDWSGNINNESNQIVTTVNSNLNVFYENNDNTFMLENDAPVISQLKTDVTTETPDDKLVSKNSYTLSFNVNDATQGNYSGLAYVSVLVNPEFDKDGKVITDTGVEVASKDIGGILNYRDDSQLLSEGEYSITAIAASSDSDKAYTVNGVKFDEKSWNNGELTYVITACDNSGNVSGPVIIELAFDQTAPVIKEFKIGDNKAKQVTVEDYGFYFKERVNITITAEDIINSNKKEAVASGVASMTVFLKDKDGTIYIIPENNSVIEKCENKSFLDASAIETDESITFTVPIDFKGQIYALAKDNAGNSPQIVDANGNVIDALRIDGLMNCVHFPDSSADVNGFVHPDGSIIETTDKHTDTSKIEFTSIPEAQGTQNNSSNYSYKGDCKSDNTMDYINNVASNQVPLYSNDITFGVKVTDTYSGIREVSYTIIEGPETTVKTVQIDNDGKFVDGKAEGWTINDSVKDINLVTEMTNNIAVSGNYNDMVLLIELTDRAGNKSYDYYVFGIDKTAPSIEVEYDNNSGDSQSGTGTYFKANRTATITVSERNFNKENVNFIVKNAEGKVPSVKFVKDIKGTGNGDDTKHIFEVTYSSNGVYSFDMNYTDRATNKNTKIDYKNSLAPKKFVVDKTKPTISVSYDNNEAQNNKFFKAHRTATIKIVEHNFDVNRAVITQTSALSGNAIKNPSVSWKNNGDTHVGTINYNSDGDYTFDITMTDKAGNKEANVNYGSSVAAKDFTVDTTYSDIVKIDGITDKGVLGLENGDIDADAKINITINDVNLDNYNIKLTRSRVLVTGESDEELDAKQNNVVDNPETQCAENNVDVTSQFVSNASGTGNNTAVIDIPKKDDKGVKNDGLYTLTIEAKDKAGNAYDTNANIITFSVNRYGSVFTFSNDLYKLLNDNDGYTKSVESTDLTVYEYNTTSVSKENVEVISNNDSKTLTANTDYTVNKDAQQTDTSWSKYAYTVKPDNFKNDGVYTLRVSSEDAASITSQTVDYDVCSATFRVDSTPADIISVNYSTEVNKIAGHNGGSAKAEKLAVNFTVEDLIRLEKVEVYVNDMTKPVKTYTYGKDFDDANTFDGGSFEIERNSTEQNFKIVATDKAGNVIDTSKGDSNGKSFEPGYVFFDHITVTTNQLVIWAKSPVFWGVIGGVVAIAVGIIIFVVVKKRKKDDDNKSTPQES